MKTKTIATAMLAANFLASGALADQLTPARIGTSVGVLMSLEISCPDGTLTSKSFKIMDTVYELYANDKEFLTAYLKSVGDHNAEIEADPSLCAKAKNMQDTDPADAKSAPDLFLKGDHVGTFSALRDFCGGTYTLPQRIIDDIGFNIVMYGKNSKFLKGYDEAYITTHRKVIGEHHDTVCFQLSLEPLVTP